MHYDELISHYGRLTDAAQALDASKQLVHNWGVRPRIPDKWQLKIERLTGGKLKADARARAWGREIARLST